MTSPFNPAVLIAGAVFGELSGIREQLLDSVVWKSGQRDCLDGILNGHRVRLVTTGPGILNTVQAITAMVELSRPRLIIQTGCGGGFAQAGMAIGDIAIATEEADAHLGIESDDPRHPDPLPFAILQGNSEKITNRFPMDASLADLAFDWICQAMAHTPVQIIKGPFVTVSTVTARDTGAATLYRRFSACMETMEGGAGAFLSNYYGIPFLQIRSASNLVGNRQRDHWDLPLAFANASAAVVQVLNHLDMLLNYIEERSFGCVTG